MIVHIFLITRARKRRYFLAFALLKKCLSSGVTVWTFPREAALCLTEEGTRAFAAVKGKCGLEEQTLARRASDKQSQRDLYPRVTDIAVRGKFSCLQERCITHKNIYI